ncbi:acyl-CoA dehydrogenase family protein [Halorarius halobius]|uniref:acyl-CoA dehydrogenase family protein n=1 Tax=Halorarius halobius TaxID=2962671 RepID=UPI0020CE2BCE|nr:acyl-CoA dehydrogenase family protein [Halorarius halobius]
MSVIPDNEYELSASERDLRQELRAFVEESVDPLDFATLEWQDDPHDRIPWDAVEAGAQRGLMDLTVPEEYGGYGASPLALVMGAEELSAGDMGLAVIFDQNWKIARVIDHLADDDVREEFFSAYVDDPRHLLAITSTEPSGGSDALLPYEKGQYDTTARKEGDEWVINGKKRYISNGADAKTYVVLAQTDPDSPHHDGGATAFYVPGDTDGLDVTNVWEKMSQRLVNNATIEYDEVRVPEAYVLGEVNEGMSSVSQVLKEGNIEAGATALGSARGALELAFEYANERTQGGKPVIDHQVTEHDFARMVTEYQAARALLWTTARAVEQQGEAYDPMFSSMAKVFAAETAVDISRRSLEKFGGEGIMLRAPIQKYFRDAVSFLHSDGTQEVHTQRVANGLRDRYEG